MKRGGPPLSALAAALAGLGVWLAWRFADGAGAAAWSAWLARIAALAGVIFAALLVFQSFRGHAFPSLRELLKIALYSIVLYYVCLCLQSYRRDAALAWLTVPLAAALGRLALLRDARGSNVDVVLLNVCFVLAGGEAVLRLVAAIRPSPLFARLNMEAAEFVDSRRGKPGHPHGGIVWNSWGEPDVEPRAKRPGECLVVAIGDSFSVGVVPHRFHFTTVAERALPGCQFYNMGVVEIGPREYRYLLQREALELRPDLIVVDLFVGNDLADNPPEEKPLDRRLRDWLDRDRLLLYAVPRRLVRWAAESRRRGALPVGKAPDDRAAHDGGLPDGALPPWLADPANEEPSFSTDAYLQIESERVALNCEDHPEVTAAFFAELERLRAAAGDVPLAFLIIPDEFQVEDSLWATVLANHPSKTAERDRPQRLIDAWLDARKIPYLDLLPLFRAAPAWSDGKKHYYHLNDSHFNARGNQLAGEALAGFARKLLDR
ncbi:MAG TPA: hypothetical protein VFF06_10875 [Polyangia bacterium]|nr:hypothetical protein [Polyangia bacterium]